MIRRWLKIGLPIVILVGAGLGVSYLRATRPQVEPEPPRERAWTVSAVPAKRTDVRPEMRLFGEVVAGRQVALRPLVAGRVAEVGENFLEGGVVRAGEMLIAIDPFAYRTQVAETEARLTEARAKRAEIAAELGAARDLLEHDREQVGLARRDVERREELRQSLAGSEKALDEARMALSQRTQQAIEREERIERLTAQLEQQRAVIDRLEVELERARRDLEDTRLEAPFNGFLVDPDAEIGKRVGVGDRVARLIDADRLEVRFHASNNDFARLLAAGGYRGRNARVLWRVGKEALAFEAVIDRVEGEIDPTTGGVELFARIRDAGPEGILRPGAFMEVLVPDRVYDNVVRLPESALHEDDTVYVVVDGRLEARDIEVLVHTAGDVLVRGALRPEDRVVTTRFPEIAPGVRVAVR